MPELAPDISLWAVANEARIWSAADVAPLKADPGSLESLLRVPKGRQRRLLSDEDPPLQRPNKPPLDGADLEARLAEALLEISAMALSGVLPVPLSSDRYPERLAQIPNPPLVLYQLGILTEFDRCVAVSGTRTPTLWGKRTAGRLARRLAAGGWVVTSGLARGIDTAAHIGALSVPAGLTAAVSALPLDRVYPPENLDIARTIAERGSLLSEHAFSKGAGKLEFLRRNRIISGISFAQLIVETSGSGGTWAQATTAKEQGRPLLALRPPRAEARAWRGFEALVELGATPVPSVEVAMQRVEELWAELDA